MWSINARPGITTRVRHTGGKTWKQYNTESDTFLDFTIVQWWRMQSGVEDQIPPGKQFSICTPYSLVNSGSSMTTDRTLSCSGKMRWQGRGLAISPCMPYAEAKRKKSLTFHVHCWIRNSVLDYNLLLSFTTLSVNWSSGYFQPILLHIRQGYPSLPK